MSDSVDSPEVQPPPEMKPGFLSKTIAALGAVATAATVLGVGIGIGHTIGESDGREQSAKLVSDLRDQVTTEKSTAQINQHTADIAQAQLKQWQDGYNKVLDANKSLSDQRDLLQQRLSEVEPCAYMEKELDQQSWVSPSNASDYAVKRRDDIQEQLSRCRRGN